MLDALTLAKRLHDGRPGVMAWPVLMDLVAALDPIPQCDRGVSLIAALDWRLAPTRADLCEWLGLDHKTIIEAIIKGRRALVEAGLGLDGRPFARPDPPATVHA